MTGPDPGHASGGSRAGRARLRIRFSKLGKIRWTSHRDVARMWERAFRRAQLPLAYSEGFSPRPRISFGLALPTGYESLAEYVDVDVSDLASVELDGLADRLSGCLPVGVDATAVAVLDPGTPSLQEAVTSCTWQWQVVASGDGDGVDPAWITERMAAALASPELVVPRTRKGVQVDEDVRPGIVELGLADPRAAGQGPALDVYETDRDSAAGVWLQAELAAQPRAVRHAEVTAALGPGLEERRVRRVNQWIQRPGARLEPLAAARGGDATGAPHALERAS